MSEDFDGSEFARLLSVAYETTPLFQNTPPSVSVRTEPSSTADTLYPVDYPPTNPFSISYRPVTVHSTPANNPPAIYPFDLPPPVSSATTRGYCEMVVEKELRRCSLSTLSKLKGLSKKKKCPKNIVTGLKTIISLGSSCRPIALDCEMVGVGEKKESALGRISIVSYDGHVLYDVMCRPEEEITDYRTPWSGIRPADMIRAIPFDCVQDQVQRIIQGRIVVGHMVFNDFRVLKIHHPKELIRDTGLAPYAKVKAGFHPKQATALRNLAEKLLGLQIQTGEHCSTEDAQATMAIYRLVEDDWEADLRAKTIKKESKTLPPSAKKRPVFDLELPTFSSDRCSSNFSEIAQTEPESSDFPSLSGPTLVKSCSSSSLLLLEDEYWDDC